MTSRSVGLRARPPPGASKYDVRTGGGNGKADVAGRLREFYSTMNQFQMRTGGGVEKSNNFEDVINGCSLMMIPAHHARFLSRRGGRIWKNNPISSFSRLFFVLRPFLSPLSA